VIGESSTAGADRFGGNGALLRKQTHSDKTFGEFAVGLFAYEFVASVSPPKINSGALEEFAGNAAEKLNQRIRVRALRSFCGKAQKEILKGSVEVSRGPAFQ
jgi:hypothetical protein